MLFICKFGRIMNKMEQFNETQPEMTLLISQQAIAKRIAELAEEINTEFEGEDIVVICILKGAVLFMTDLVRRLNVPMTIEFLELRSYNLTSSTGKVNVVKDIGMDKDLTGKNLLVIEDIVDTGTTLQFIYDHLTVRGPAKIKTCVLLDNPARRKIENITPDFTGFTIPNKFVMGYGLDYDQRYRNLPYIACIEKNGGSNG